MQWVSPLSLYEDVRSSEKHMVLLSPKAIKPNKLASVSQSCEHILQQPTEMKKNGYNSLPDPQCSCSDLQGLHVPEASAITHGSSGFSFTFWRTVSLQRTCTPTWPADVTPSKTTSLHSVCICLCLCNTIYMCTIYSLSCLRQCPSILYKCLECTTAGTVVSRFHILAYRWPNPFASQFVSTVLPCRESHLLTLRLRSSMVHLS